MPVHDRAGPSLAASACSALNASVDREGFSSRVFGLDPNPCVMETPNAALADIPRCSANGIAGILSPSTAASKKLARLGGKVVAFTSEDNPKADRSIHRAILNAGRKLRRRGGPTLTRVIDPALPWDRDLADRRVTAPHQCPNQWVQGYVMGRPVSSSSSGYRPQSGVFSAGDLDTTAANLLRQYRRVLPAPPPGPAEECGLKRR